MSRRNRGRQFLAIPRGSSPHPVSAGDNSGEPTQGIDILPSDPWHATSSPGTSAKLESGDVQIRSNETTVPGVIDNFLQGRYSHGGTGLKAVLAAGIFCYFLVRDNELGLLRQSWAWDSLAWSMVKGAAAAVVLFGLLWLCDALPSRR